MTGSKAGIVARLFGSGLVVATILVGVAGCGKGDTNIKGKVTYKGKSISSGLLSFDSKPAASAPITDGFFNVPKFPASGKMKVCLKVDKNVDPKEAFDDKKVKEFATSGQEITVEDGKTNEYTIDFK